MRDISSSSIRRSVTRSLALSTTILVALQLGRARRSATFPPRWATLQVPPARPSRSPATNWACSVSTRNGGTIRAEPRDKRIVMNYALGLRAAQRHEQAIAILQKASIKSPNDVELLAALRQGAGRCRPVPGGSRCSRTRAVPERPNWSVLSTQGSVADQMGNHTLAQQYYNEALKISPGEPSVLSNLGLSYALSRQLPQGEQSLRQANSHPRADRPVGRTLHWFSRCKANSPNGKRAAEGPFAGRCVSEYRFDPQHDRAVPTPGAKFSL